MSDAFDPASLRPDHVFDGGGMDCGTGLVLLIKENMERVPIGGVLELRSREPTVGTDLPPWCRMVGHEFLGSTDAEDRTCYFLRRGEKTSEQAEVFEDDKVKARSYEWRARTRPDGAGGSTVYCRNLRLAVGQQASFARHDERPSAVELLLASLAGDLCAGFTAACERAGLLVDDVEMTIKGRLRDVLVHLGVEGEGDAGFEAIRLRCFVTSREDEAALGAAWEDAVRRSPTAATLAKAVDLDLTLALV